MTPDEYQAFSDKTLADAEEFYDRQDAFQAQSGPSMDTDTAAGTDFPTADHDDSDESNSTAYDPSNDVDDTDDMDDMDDDLF
ncbi:hypothetical protein [Streptomyces sp. NBC_01216]|uniref:hypothetical protein n=1 Tax=unclassified Streptomyces TaxID=2593676 RepID=UPI002E0E675F|nr:hypothetical protein OG393_21575 [Streptomyces sp. NBC_01216]